MFKKYTNVQSFRFNIYTVKRPSKKLRKKLLYVHCETGRKVLLLKPKNARYTFIQVGWVTYIRGSSGAKHKGQTVVNNNNYFAAKHLQGQNKSLIFSRKTK